VPAAGRPAGRLITRSCRTWPAARPRARSEPRVRRSPPRLARRGTARWPGRGMLCVLQVALPQWFRPRCPPAWSPGRRTGSSRGHRNRRRPFSPPLPAGLPCLSLRWERTAPHRPAGRHLATSSPRTSLRTLPVASQPASRLAPVRSRRPPARHGCSRPRSRRRRGRRPLVRCPTGRAYRRGHRGRPGRSAVLRIRRPAGERAGARIGAGCPAAVVWAWILVWAWMGTAEGRAVARSACRVRAGRLALVGEVVAIPADSGRLLAGLPQSAAGGAAAAGGASRAGQQQAQPGRGDRPGQADDNRGDQDDEPPG
jgi:hypothetical protein